MPNFQGGIQGPNLSGLSAPVRQDVGVSSRAANAQLATTLISGALNLYGTSQAKKAGARIGGEGETFESAGVAADAAVNELEGLRAAKEAEIGAPVTEEQAADLRKSVFDKTLNNQKRIQSALARGLISSTEANARLNVLRNEALSNPLIAPFKDQLDNALYRTTGGAGTFGATAAELEQAALEKGRMEALEAQNKQVTEYIRSGVANSESQALNIIAQSEQLSLNAQFYADKKARLGLTSDESYAAAQDLSTSQAASAYKMIADWSAVGGNAKDVPALQMKLSREAEDIKKAIRAMATDAQGNLLVDSETLRTQLSEVDRRTEQYYTMINDQSGTADLMAQMKQRAASLDYKGQTLQIELARHAPLLFALKDFPAASEWYWNNAVNTQAMSTRWQAASNPLLRFISQMSPKAAAKNVEETADTFLNGGILNELQKAIASTTLMLKGGTAAVDKAMETDPEQTLVTLSETPIHLRDVFRSNEWLGRARSEEDKEVVQVMVEGAASRAVLSSMNQGTRRETPEEAAARGTNRRRWSVPDIRIPTSIKLQQKKPNNKIPQLSSNIGKTDDWIIDTGGVAVTDEYKSEVVNAYKLGVAAPQLWQDDFESVDQWINHLFARPVGGDNDTAE